MPCGARQAHCPLWTSHFPLLHHGAKGHGLWGARSWADDRKQRGLRAAEFWSQLVSPAPPGFCAGATRATCDHWGSSSRLVCCKGQAPHSKRRDLSGLGNLPVPGTAYCRHSLINYGNKLKSSESKGFYHPESLGLRVAEADSASGWT